MPNKKKTSKPVYKIRTCLICEKPFKGRKSKCCVLCRKHLTIWAERLHSIYKRISIGSIIFLKEYLEEPDIWNRLEKDPSAYSLVFKYTNAQARREYRKLATAKYKADEYQNASYLKFSEEIPLYITTLMRKYPVYKLIGLSGSKDHPNIHFICNRCNNELCIPYHSFTKKNGVHGCDATISSGEALVKNYLKKLSIPFKTQFHTLKCVNPITKYVLPYDFDLYKDKIIIEVQGTQHLKFIPHFHVTAENFEYQQRKDDYKKRYAEAKEYKMLYIYYDEFENDTYKFKIHSTLYAEKS